MPAIGLSQIMRVTIALAMTISVTTASLAANSATSGVATFAGGCFWCVEADFDHVPGVLETTSGYTGGRTKNPTYRDVSYSNTGHYEAVQIKFDPKLVSYAKLVEIFWRSVDPTDKGGQFCDRGHSYKTAIFTHSEAQAQAAEASKITAASTLKKPIATPILAASRFYPAEDEHQDYYNRNPVRYSFYRAGCGRDKRIKSLWGSEAHKGIKKD
jgi:peptide-methionine (S)-S-oxide reductase